TPNSCSRDCAMIAVSAARNSSSSRLASAAASGKTIHPGNRRSASISKVLMKWIEYSRYTGEDLGLSAEDLMRALSDFFLQSGFEYQYMNFSEMDKHSLDRLKEALEKALRDGDLFDRDMNEAM